MDSLETDSSAPNILLAERPSSTVRTSFYMSSGSDFKSPTDFLILPCIVSLQLQMCRHSNSKQVTVTSRAAERGFGYRRKFFSGYTPFPARSNWLKSLTKSERMTLTCRVNWAWSESVNLYSGQSMISPRNTKNICNIVGSHSGQPGHGNL